MNQSLLRITSLDKKNGSGEQLTTVMTILGEAEFYFFENVERSRFPSCRRLPRIKEGLQWILTV